MKKLWLALGAVLAVSIGVALAEGKDSKTSADGKSESAACKPDSAASKSDSGACCCCAKSCPK